MKETYLDRFKWIRGALRLCNITEDHFETWCHAFGDAKPVAEYVLLFVTSVCEDNKDLWDEAIKLGIPFVPKTWTGTSELQADYAVGIRIPQLRPISESTTDDDEDSEDLIPEIARGSTRTDKNACADASASLSGSASSGRWQTGSLAATNFRDDDNVSEHWPRLSKAKAVVKRKSKAGERSGKHHHDATQLEIEIVYRQHKCPFSQKPKYTCNVAMPNIYNLKYVYSVPCGGHPDALCPKERWIFLVGERIGERKWVDEYLETLGWGQVTNTFNKRFLCPDCWCEK